ncbi:MAG TPA: hypothetical protein VLA09_08315, partial [Longimicrobiales bacterium]|nr:hypothetical protein [Longimicrobiales bacterium]
MGEFSEEDWAGREQTMRLPASLPGVGRHVGNVSVRFGLSSSHWSRDLEMEAHVVDDFLKGR